MLELLLTYNIDPNYKWHKLFFGEVTLISKFFILINGDWRIFNKYDCIDTIKILIKYDFNFDIIDKELMDIIKKDNDLYQLIK